ncbi:MAG TPA: HD domain-containing protein [Burkholderiales bacterium]|nr:HD domain-containing protein [Burkholderiales bacterium]
MSFGNHYDVSNNVDVTDSRAVSAAVIQIFRELYPGAPDSRIDQVFRDLESLYHGKFPGFHACDTPYHDIQHVLNVTLAMARLMDGYERSQAGAERLEATHFCLGIVTALFHDCGYVRRLDDVEHRNGAEMTLTHVSRGADFLKAYLPMIGMADMAGIAAALVHFTGYEIPVAQIVVPSLRYRLLGSLLGSADIIAQMSDRCYLEKCRDRLYPEFVAAGIARKRLPSGKEDIVFESGDDLVMKTPKFYAGAARRLDEDLGAGYQYISHHFGDGHDPYLKEISRNVEFAQSINRSSDTSTLKRIPPRTLAADNGAITAPGDAGRAST